MIKILFVGEVNCGEAQRGFQRYRALTEISPNTDVVPLDPPCGHKSSFFERVMWKFSLPIDVAHANSAILKKLNAGKFDIVWIEKGNTIYPQTLRKVKKLQPKIKLISLSEDDMYATHNRSWYYTRGLKYYDAVFTTKTYNLQELKELGAVRTELFLDAYDEKLHRPVNLTLEEKKEYGSDVGFIGTFEEDRANKILYLAEHGISVVVWGNGWARWEGKHPHLVIKGVPLYGEDYVKAINATKINLGFLRKANRDQVTSRSVEIPACGAFLLAERTKRHLEFFEEGKEAEFFDSNEEMLEKVKKYLANDGIREKVAKAGRERCLRSGYGVRTQLKNILRKIEKI